MPVATQSAPLLPLIVMCCAPLLAALSLWLLGSRLTGSARRLMVGSGLMAAAWGIVVAASNLDRGGAAHGFPEAVGATWLVVSDTQEAGVINAGVAPTDTSTSLTLSATPHGLLAALSIVLLACLALALRARVAARTEAGLGTHAVLTLVLTSVAVFGVCGGGMVAALISVTLLSLPVWGSAQAASASSWALAARADALRVTFGCAFAWGGALILMKYAGTESWHGVERVVGSLASRADLWDMTSDETAWLPNGLRSGTFPPAQVVSFCLLAGIGLNVLGMSRAARRHRELLPLLGAVCVVWAAIMWNWIKLARPEIARWEGAGLVAALTLLVMWGIAASVVRLLGRRAWSRVPLVPRHERWFNGSWRRAGFGCAALLARASERAVGLNSLVSSGRLSKLVLPALVAFPLLLLGWFSVPRPQISVEQRPNGEFQLRAREGYGYAYAWSIRIDAEASRQAQGRDLVLTLEPGQRARALLTATGPFGGDRSEELLLVRPRFADASGPTLQLEIGEDGKLRARGAKQP